MCGDCGDCGVYIKSKHIVVIFLQFSLKVVFNKIIYIHYFDIYIYLHLIHIICQFLSSVPLNSHVSTAKHAHHWCWAGSDTPVQWQEVVMAWWNCNSGQVWLNKLYIFTSLHQLMAQVNTRLVYNKEYVKDWTKLILNTSIYS